MPRTVKGKSLCPYLVEDSGGPSREVPSIDKIRSPFLTFSELSQSDWNVELMTALSPPVLLSLHSWESDY